MRAVHSPQSTDHRQRSPTSYWVFLCLSYFILSLSAQPVFALVTEPPPGVNADNYYFKKGYLDVTLYGADPTGQIDSTQAIQNAVNAARDYQLAVFFPNQASGERGIYLISNTIKCMKDFQSVFGVYGAEYLPNVLIGSTKGKVRPIIKLKANTSLFSNPNNPVPVIRFWAIPTGYVSPEHAGSKDPQYSEDDVSFDQIFKGIDIDLSGNPGAYGIRNAGAQGAAIEDVKINAVGAFAGLGKFGVLGCATYNVEVEGGQYAVYGTPDGDSLSTYNGHGIMIGCTFKNQEKAVLYLYNTVAPVILTGCHIIQENTIPNQEKGILTLNAIDKTNGLYINNVRGMCGGISLVDSIVEINGGRIFNDNANFHMRNVYVKGCDSVANGWNITDKIHWTQVKEYVYIKNYSKNLIDGNLNTNEYKDKVEGLNTQTENLVNSLVKKHLWDEASFPSFEDADVVDVKDLGVKGDGATDDTAALQAAIDQHQKLFLSKGIYLVSQPIMLKSETQLFGVTSIYSRIAAINSWAPLGETIILTTVDDKDAKTLLAFMSVNNEWYEIAGQNGFTPIEWHAGRNSMTRNVMAEASGKYENGKVLCLNYHRFKISGSGGGRHFSLLGRWKGGSYNSRSLLIENTTEPLLICAFNAAAEPEDIDIEIKNSKNVNFYGYYCEGPVTAMRIDKSEDIYLFTGNKNNEPGNYRGGIEIFDSNNVMASNFAFTRMGRPISNIYAYSLKEIYSAIEATISHNEANIALYKRGACALILYGDVSGDGIVSAYDAAMTAQAAVGLITLTPEQTQAADVSGDGKVTAYDAALIAQKAVGLIDKFPVEG